MNDPLRDYMRNWFLGVHVKQWNVEFLVWENFFLRCGKLSRIVELGSGQGGFSFYLFLQAKKRRAQFDTWDIAPVHVATWTFAKELGFDLCCHTGDILNDEDVITSIGNLVGERGTTLLFCDNGAKIKEVAMYTPYLKKDDILAVHDWGQEIFPKNVKDLPLEMIDVPLIEETGSWTRWFRVNE